MAWTPWTTTPDADTRAAIDVWERSATSTSTTTQHNIGRTRHVSGDANVRYPLDAWSRIQLRRRRDGLHPVWYCNASSTTTTWFTAQVTAEVVPSIERWYFMLGDGTGRDWYNYGREAAVYGVWNDGGNAFYASTPTGGTQIDVGATGLGISGYTSPPRAWCDYVFQGCGYCTYSHCQSVCDQMSNCVGFQHMDASVWQRTAARAASSAHFPTRRPSRPTPAARPPSSSTRRTTRSSTATWARRCRGARVAARRRGWVSRAGNRPAQFGGTYSDFASAATACIAVDFAACGAIEQVGGGQVAVVSGLNDIVGTQGVSVANHAENVAAGTMLTNGGFTHSQTAGRFADAGRATRRPT